MPLKLTEDAVLAITKCRFPLNQSIWFKQHYRANIISKDCYTSPRDLVYVGRTYAIEFNEDPKYETMFRMKYSQYL